MSDDVLRVLCMRTADVPVPGVKTATVWNCSACNEPCWRGPGLPREAICLCMHCAPFVMEDDDRVIAPLPEQRAALHDHGVTDADIRRGNALAGRYLKAAKRARPRNT